MGSELVNEKLFELYGISALEMGFLGYLKHLGIYEPTEEGIANMCFSFSVFCIAGHLFYKISSFYIIANASIVFGIFLIILTKNIPFETLYKIHEKIYKYNQKITKKQGEN